LSFEIVATQRSTAVTKSAYAISSDGAVTPANLAITSSISDAPITTRIAKPETGLFEEPIRPAM
jgi:hypothetical protein